MAWLLSPPNPCKWSLSNFGKVSMQACLLETVPPLSLMKLSTLLSHIMPENLQKILQKNDDYLTLTNLYQHKLMKSHLLIFRDTISTLIDQGKSTSSNTDSNCSENAEDTTVHTSRFIFFHRASQAFWLGHTERCHHYFLKVLQLSVVIAKLANIIATFYQGLNTFQLLKRQNTAKLRAITRNAIKVLKAAQSHSDWNFSNKVRRVTFVLPFG